MRGVHPFRVWWCAPFRDIVMKSRHSHNLLTSMWYKLYFRHGVNFEINYLGGDYAQMELKLCETPSMGY